MYKWPLNISNFNFIDRLKIASFILKKENRWTQGDIVEKFEYEFSKYIDCKYSIFVSSGSTANTMIAMYLKDKIKNGKNKILFPSTTWITSISPFIREGFEPVFIDISLKDLAIDLDKVEDYLKNNKDVLCIFPTSLLGFVPDLDRLRLISDKYDVKIFMDNCENTFGEFENKNISSYFTSTTSTYFGHQIQSIEGGFIFTNSIDEYEYFKMVRNHGMIRSLDNSTKYQNKLVDSRFDFYLLGNNFRNTNINAYIGLVDFSKKDIYKQKRIELYKIFYDKIDHSKFILPEFSKNKTHVPFSLPIISNVPGMREIIIKYCEDNHIESRPIISGNLLRQTCLQKYAIYKDYINSELLNNNGLYVGLYSKLNVNSMIKFINDINNV